jgi:polysaccharide pyruvyl transferase WcaK-like protein
MIVEVTGTSVRNKGAELMLLAIQQQLAQLQPDIQLAVSSAFGGYEDKTKYGLLQKVDIRRRGRSRLGFQLLPEGFCRAYGLVDERDTRAVLDASGFAFGDQHESRRVLEFAALVKRWRAQGKTIVLLPQALGPFTRRESSDAFKSIAENVDLIYARDAVSLEHLEGLCGSDARFRQAPDFTNLLKPACLPDSVPECLIVPNHRMVEKMGAEDAGQYIPFLARVVEQAEALQLDTAVLLHDTVVDHELVEPLEQQLGRSIRIIQASDPLKLKAWLGAAKVVVGSRFHALVGALSQGVPTLASGWSHKYQMLLEDYGCPELVLPVSADVDQVALSMQQAVRAPGRDRLVKCLEEHGAAQGAAVETMWSEVMQVLNA